MGEPLEHDWSGEDIEEHHDGHELELGDSDLTSLSPHSVKSSEATLAQTASSEHAVSEVSTNYPLKNAHIFDAEGLF